MPPQPCGQTRAEGGAQTLQQTGGVRVRVGVRVEVGVRVRARVRVSAKVGVGVRVGVRVGLTCSSSSSERPPCLSTSVAAHSLWG